MRILITTGIFEPEPGGPATYTPKIAKKLIERGHTVSVVTYSNKISYPNDSTYPFRLIRVVRSGGRLKNYWSFLWTVYYEVRGCDLVYSLDWLAAGLPVSIVAAMRGVPYVIRIGGDYAWEQKYLESGAEPVTLSDFYDRGIYRQYRLIYWFVRFVLTRARHVIFNTIVQRDMYVKYFGLSDSRVSTIFNPIPKEFLGDIVRSEPNREIVFFGRLVVMKNVVTLVKAFAQAKIPASYRLVLFGDGPQEGAIRKLVTDLGMDERIDIMSSLPQRELYKRIKDCRAIVLPSWTDISPNQVYEALLLGIPVLATKENYLSIRDQLPEQIDPRSVHSVRERIEMLTDDESYQRFVDAFCSIHYTHSWDEACSQHIDIFKRVIRSV